MTAAVQLLADGALDEVGAERVARQFAALADPVRVRIMSLLANSLGRAACVSELVDEIDRSQPTVSHHLKVLYEAGLVTSEKQGRNVWYIVSTDALERLRGILAT